MSLLLYCFIIAYFIVGFMSNIEDKIKYNLFGIIAFVPIGFAFIFFDISPLLHLKITSVLSPKYSFVLIAIAYTAMMVLLSMGYTYMFIKLTGEMKLSLLYVFCIACIKSIFETAVPFFITKYLGGNIIHFFENTALFCGITLGISFVFLLLMKPNTIT